MATLYTTSRPLLSLANRSKDFLDPASFSCTTGLSDHTLKGQRGGGEASQLNGSVLECRLRLSEDRPLGTGKERQRFKVGVRSAAVKVAPGRRGVGGECDVPVGFAGFVPGFISSHSGSIRRPCVLQHAAGGPGSRHHPGACAAGVLGVRGHGEGRGRCWVGRLVLKSVVKRNGSVRSHRSRSAILDLWAKCRALG